MMDRAAPPGPNVPPLLAALRSGTMAAHARIEALPSMAVLLSPELSAGAYVAALAALHGFYAAMQSHLAPLLVKVPGVPPPDPAALEALADDLAWFGAAVPRPAAGRPHVGATPACLGALYVVEGSALGGRVIGRAVSQSIGVRPGRGGSFFCGPTADQARHRWREFCAVLAREGDGLDEAGSARVVDAAYASFAYLEKTLCRHAAPASPVCQALHRAASAPRVVSAAGTAARTMN